MIGRARRWMAMALAAVSVAASSVAWAQDLRALQALDARVSAIGYRLATSAGDLCPAAPAQLGFSVHDLSQYPRAEQAAARATFGFGSLPLVLAVAPGSPAARAGVRAEDAIVAIDGTAIALTAAAGSFARMATTLDALDAAMADGQVTLSLLRGGQRLEVVLTAAPGCRSRFLLTPGPSLNAEADGTFVQISSRLALYAADDAELAALLAHELSHNILSHRARLDAAGIRRGVLQNFGRNARLTRETEVEADRLAVYLLDRAGYPTRAAVTFWTRYRREHGMGFLRAPTHPGEKARIASAQGEIDRIARLRAAGQPVRPDFLP